MPRSRRGWRWRRCCAPRCRQRFEVFEGKAAREARLPALPEFRINLYAPPGFRPAARDLADHVRASFALR